MHRDGGRLLQYGKTGRVHEVAVDMIRQRSLRFRFRFHFLPVRIGLERSPILLCFVTTTMFQDIDKEVLRIRRIFGPPITDAFHVMTLKDRVSVITKASY